jgi:hypothetical protein
MAWQRIGGLDSGDCASSQSVPGNFSEVCTCRVGSCHVCVGTSRQNDAARVVILGHVAFFFSEQQASPIFAKCFMYSFFSRVM